MEPVQTLLSRNIRTIREQGGWSREQFSEKVGISVNYLSEVEAGKKFPRPQVLDSICQVASIQPSDLFKSNQDLLNALSLETFSLQVSQQFPEFIRGILQATKKPKTE